MHYHFTVISVGLRDTVPYVKKIQKIGTVSAGLKQCYIWEILNFAVKQKYDNHVHLLLL